MNENHNAADILKNFAAYLKVLPDGLRLPDGKLQQRLSGQILWSGPARTLYQDRQPVCRSLDGLQALKTNDSCCSCQRRNRCTSQIRLDLLHSSGVLRLLLAYTSARNFLLFLSAFQTNGCPIEGAFVTITVLNRGRWGELRFSAGDE